MATYSKTLYISSVDELVKLFKKSISKFDKFSQDTKLKYMEMYTRIIIYFDEKRSDMKELFFKNVSYNYYYMFVKSLSYNIRPMGDEKINIFWKIWLREFTVSRYKYGGDTLTDEEKCQFLYLSLDVGSNFKDFINIISKENMPKRIDYLFFHNLRSKCIDSKFPESVGVLIVHMLKDGTNIDFFKTDLVKIFISIKERLGKETLRSLENAMLYRNLNIDY